MKWLANRFIFDLMVMLPTLCVMSFCVWKYHNWMPLIILCVGYAISWVVTWKK